MGIQVNIAVINGCFVILESDFRGAVSGLSVGGSPR
jgi:hypothetical protein